MTQNIPVPAAEGTARLNTLTRLASCSAQSNKPSRIVSEAVLALNADICIFHEMPDQADQIVAAVFARTGVDADLAVKISSVLAPRVKADRQRLILNDLKSEFRDNVDIADCSQNCYLGVPVFDAGGGIGGVASLMTSSERPITDEDAWWLEFAAQLAGLSLSCDKLQKRIAEMIVPGRSREPGSARAGRQRTTQPSSPDSKEFSILLVDDDRAISNLIKRYLVRQGYAVDCAVDGHHGLEMFGSSSYDLVITDIVMPGMNGWELVASVHAIEPNLPIIIITGYSDNNNGVWSKPFLRSQGVISVLNKPLDLEFLASVLSDLPAVAARAI